MRNAFFSELAGVIAGDPRVVFLTGDLGYKLFEPLRELAPDRVLNFGIREAGMVGYAAGLAKAGALPFVYSIVPFITLRCLEQIKIDLCYNRCPAVVVGVGGGLAYGPNGPTHHGVDDVGVLGGLPDLTIWTPGDGQEVRACVRAALALQGPAYLRLGRGGEPLWHRPEDGLPDISQPQLLGEPSQGLIISYGHLLHEVLAARELLAQGGLRPAFLHLPTLRPFPAERLAQLLAAAPAVLCLEEHVANGGLGQQVAVLLAESGASPRFARLCLPDQFPASCQDRASGLAQAGLDPEAMARRFQALWAAR